MNFEMPFFTAAIPEIFVLSMACVVLLVDLFSNAKRRHLTYALTQLTLIAAAALTIKYYPQTPVVTFAGAFVLDKLACLLKLAIYITSFFAFWYSHQYVEARHMPRGEYYVLGLFAVLGMMVMVSAYNFLSIYLGLELLSLPLYAMVALRRDNAIASEAAMKYFVMGALASGMLLYGISMLYGASKSLDVTVVAKNIAGIDPSQNLILIFALVFIVAGLVFKFGAAPFHMWVPDVYHGAPTSVTLFIGSAPKIAAYGITIRLLVEAMPSFHLQWQQLLIATAILSMAIGNLVAIVQTNLKRMLAYSSIAHMGYMSLGLLAVTPSGYAASVFYMIAYAVMTLCAFGAIILLSRAGFEGEEIADFQGLNSRNPWLAFMMLIVMFSMAGIPPTVGFFAKLGVLEALVGVNLVWLATLALIFAIIGAYYYLRIIKVMYFENPSETTPLVNSGSLRIAITVNGLVVLLLGLFPSSLIQVCRNAFLSGL